MNEKTADHLSRTLAEPIARMWKWAFASSREKRQQHEPELREMQEFERAYLRDVDKSSWPLSLKVPLLLSRSRSDVSFAAGYLATQAMLRARSLKSRKRSR